MTADRNHSAAARRLRREPTNAEQALWSRLRNRQLEGVKFRRQQAIGRYIVDFVSFERMLVVEVDGGQHSQGQRRASDNRRTRWLEEEGFRILRFWNNDVLSNLEGVLDSIRAGQG